MYCARKNRVSLMFTPIPPMAGLSHIERDCGPLEEFVI